MGTSLNFRRGCDDLFGSHPGTRYEPNGIYKEVYLRCGFAAIRVGRRAAVRAEKTGRSTAGGTPDGSHSLDRRAGGRSPAAHHADFGHAALRPLAQALSHPGGHPGPTARDHVRARRGRPWPEEPLLARGTLGSVRGRGQCGSAGADPDLTRRPARTRPRVPRGALPPDARRPGRGGIVGGGAGHARLWSCPRTMRAGCVWP